MELVNDKDDPDLLGYIESNDDFFRVNQMVKNMNKDLIDSGFDQYQYKTVLQGKKVYIKKK